MSAIGPTIIQADGHARAVNRSVSVRCGMTAA